MPTGPRIRSNSVFGTVADNPLTSSATTLTSNQLVLLPGVIASHAIITLDPLRQFGDPEIVIVTAHTPASTVATIQRGAYGTAAREHPFATVWVHALIDEDTTEIVTSSTRPTDPYRGQMIFESDTNKFVARSTSDVWIDAIPLGAWQLYTPSWTNVTLGTGPTNSGRFARIGRMIFWHASLTLGTGGAVTGSIQVSLPATASSAWENFASRVDGCDLMDATGAGFKGALDYTATTAILLVLQADSTYLFGNATSGTVPFTWTVSDRMTAYGFYEAAS